MSYYTRSKSVNWTNLSHDEGDYSDGSTEKSGEHENLETEDDSLVLQTPQRCHRRQRALFAADVHKHLQESAGQCTSSSDAAK